MEANKQVAWVPLSDVQWTNIVNHDNAYYSFTKDEAIHEAVKRTEAKLKELNAAHLARQDQAAPIRSFDKAQVLEAWACVRKNNSSIPDGALDDMRDAMLSALGSAPQADIGERLRYVLDELVAAEQFPTLQSAILDALQGAPQAERAAVPEGWQESIFAAMDKAFNVTHEKGKSYDGALVIDDTQVGVEFAIKQMESMLAAAPSPAAAQEGEQGSVQAALAFPERDLTKPAEQQGMFRKFEVRRVDGSDQRGGKHEGCRYFVLDLNHDQHARAAMLAYAASCTSTHPKLAADIIAEFGATSAASSESFDTPDALRDAVAEALCGLYWCDRVWSAWSVGTMGEDDFSPADEDENIINNVLDAVKPHIESLIAAKVAGVRKDAERLANHLSNAHRLIESTEAFGNVAASGILECDGVRWDIDKSKEALAAFNAAMAAQSPASGGQEDA